MSDFAHCGECGNEYRPEGDQREVEHGVVLALAKEIAEGLMVRGGYLLTEELAIERGRNLALRLAERFQITRRDR